MLESHIERAPRSNGAPRSEKRPRRTQKERSAETRALLLEVTVSCLAELGYVGTTSKVVAERAGLSRGAQLHHFGTKAQLVTTALQHLFDRRFEEFTRGFSEMREGTDPAEAAVELLWGIMSGPSGYAYLELVCAARTDPELRDAIIALNARLDEQVDVTFRKLFKGAPGSEEHFDIAWTALFALMEGLAFEKIVRKEDDRVDRVVSALKAFAPMLIRAS